MTASPQASSSGTSTSPTFSCSSSVELAGFVTPTVANFEYNPADAKFQSLLELTRPLGDLEDRLLEDLAGQTLAFEELYELHGVGKPYVLPSYREVLCRMELEGKVTMEKLAEPLRWGTPKTVFVNSMSDLFHEDVPDWYVEQVARVILSGAGRGLFDSDSVPEYCATSGIRRRHATSVAVLRHWPEAT